MFPEKCLKSHNFSYLWNTQRSLQNYSTLFAARLSISAKSGDTDTHPIRETVWHPILCFGSFAVGPKSTNDLPSSITILIIITK